jgi:hypothetical protein
MTIIERGCRTGVREGAALRGKGHGARAWKETQKETQFAREQKKDVWGGREAKERLRLVAVDRVAAWRGGG